MADLKSKSAGAGAAPVEEAATNENKQSARATNHSREWFGRVFCAGFTPEDAVLYGLTVLLIVFFWATFANLYRQEGELLPGISREVTNLWQPVTWDEYTGWEDGSLALDYIRAQVVITAMRYQQGSISSAAISTRKDLGFVVGTITMILGCIIVIRGVRGSTNLQIGSADQPSPGGVVPVSLTTNLPGIVIVVVGGLIVMLTVLTSGERPAISDDGIRCPLCSVGAVSSSQTVVTGELEATPTVEPAPTTLTPELPRVVIPSVTAAITPTE